MSLIKWSEEISVGIKSLDDEHKRMVETLNDFYDALKEDNGEQVLGDILDSLVGYVTMHFKHEEDLFIETAFPDAETHKKQHQIARERIFEIQDEYHNGASLELCHELFQFMAGWFADHLINLDQKYVAHFNAHGIH